MKRCVHRLAAEDLAEAAKFYKREAGAGIAGRFLAEFERVADLLAQHPGIGTPTADGRRAYPLADFPYAVSYRIDDSVLRILVVRHQRRDPEFGGGRQ